MLLIISIRSTKNLHPLIFFMKKEEGVFFLLLAPLGGFQPKPSRKLSIIIILYKNFLLLSKWLYVHFYNERTNLLLMIIELTYSLDFS